MPAVWMCPECGHGSPEMRDERAHLDAHRQLQAFFREWESRTSAPVEARRSWWPKVVVALVVVLVLLASVGVFARINRAPDAVRATVPARVAPVDDLPRRPEAVPPAPTAAVPVPPPAAPAQAARAVTPAPSPAAHAPSAPVVEVEVLAPSTPAPILPVAAPAPGPHVAPTVPPAPHLLSLCILGICLDVF